LNIQCEYNYSRVNSHILFLGGKRGELITVQSSFNGFGDLLPPTSYSSSIGPAAEVMFCPMEVKKPANVDCRVSGNFLFISLNFLLLNGKHKKSNFFNNINRP